MEMVNGRRVPHQPLPKMPSGIPARQTRRLLPDSSEVLGSQKRFPWSLGSHGVPGVTQRFSALGPMGSGAPTSYNCTGKTAWNPVQLECICGATYLPTDPTKGVTTAMDIGAG